MIRHGNREPRDPLLAVTRFILKIMMMVTIVGAIAMALAIPILLVWRARATAWLIGDGAPAGPMWALLLLPALGVLAAVLIFYFSRELYRIIGTVGEGTPFVPANARRLRSMAWLGFFANVVAIPLSTLGKWVRSITHELRLEAELPLAGLFLALILFILARVFREGARMREDLEATV